MSAVWLSNLRHPIMVIRGQSCAASFAQCLVLPIFSQLPCPCCLVTAVLSWHGVPTYTCCLDLALKGNRVRFAYSSYHQLTPFEAPYQKLFCSNSVPNLQRCSSSNIILRLGPLWRTTTDLAQGWHGPTLKLFKYVHFLASLSL